MRSGNSNKITKEQEQALKTVAKGAGIAFIGLLIGRFFGYLTRVVIARSIGPSSYGILSLGLGIINIFAIFSLLGLSGGLDRTIAFYLGRKKLEKVKGAIISSFKISLPISIFFSLLLIYFSYNISVAFSKPLLNQVLKILSLSIPFFTTLLLSQSIFLGHKLVKYKVYTRDIGRNLTTLLLSIILIYFFGLGILGASLSFLLGFVFSGILSIIIINKKIFPKLKGVSPQDLEKELLTFSIPLFFSGLVLLVLQWTDVLMLGYFRTSSEIGIYKAALDTGVLLTIFLSSFNFIFLPIISEFFSHNKLADIRKLYSTITRWMVSLTFPLFIIFALFPDNILKLLFGPSFVGGSNVLLIISLAYFLAVLMGPTDQTILSIGKTRVIFYL
ncbi:MAG: flippase, partial [Candidatus Aenigmarchaeota archaeon]|nr:flippase [Candidatus Aenigmarchaeota archaeon]